MPLTVALLMAAGTPLAQADAGSKLAQEAAEYVMGRFGRQVAKEGVESLAARIECYAARHGEGFYAAVRKVGPSAFRLVEEAGEHSPQAISILSRFGEDGAVWVVSRPRAMTLVLKHGEEAAAVLAKTRGVAEPAVSALGKPAVGAFGSLSTGQSARRLAMVAQGGELAATGQASEVLSVIAKYGDPAMDFLWRHKGVLASTVALTAFIANPEPYISGAKDITQIVAENTVKPLAEVPATVAREAAGEVARKTNWTVIFSFVVAALGGLAALRSWRKSRHGCHRS
ncbi:MAG: hypothetical protein WB760_05450 [Xanthobacteraceae bacterium]